MMDILTTVRGPIHIDIDKEDIIHMLDAALSLDNVG